jgi:hypothetical protein
MLGSHVRYVLLCDIWPLTGQSTVLNILRPCAITSFSQNQIILDAGTAMRKTRMTEYEIADLLTGMVDGTIATFQMYISLAIAYLVATYLAANRMTRSQIVSISTLFSVAALLATWATYSYMARAVPLADELELINPDKRYGAQPLARDSLAILMIVGIIASVKFVWDVRHHKLD